MLIEWPEYKAGKPTGKILSAPVPEDVMEFVEVIGLDLTAKLLISFGGTVPTPPVTRTTGRNKLVRVLGEEAALAFGNRFGRMGRLPLANVFLARYLRGRGDSINEIACKLRIPDVTIFKYLRRGEENNKINRSDHIDMIADGYKRSAERHRKREALKRLVAPPYGKSGRQPQ